MAIVVFSKLYGLNHGFVPSAARTSTMEYDMGLGTGAIKLYLQLYQRGLLSEVESVLDMGSQDLHLTKVRLAQLLQSAGITDYDDKVFSGLNTWPVNSGISASEFYAILGISDYRCMDLSYHHSAINHDLNLPVTDESLFGKFDMITVHGTNEHVFNIVETYRTMHNFDLSFFESMAAANNYKILFSSFQVQVQRQNLTQPEAKALIPGWEHHHRRDQYHIPLSNDLLHTINWSSGQEPELGINYVFQKQSETEFQYGYQGEFQSRVSEHYGFDLQFLPDPPSRSYVPIRYGNKNGLRVDILECIPVRMLAKHLTGRILKHLRRKRY